ncbi:RnfH family protein [Mitsuaria sp. GD03876]|uniref:RnfH family protein n=1 Tax=Mitsuaria sp. GD03876 TaxID=2975399 RepID=UPI002446D13F|nr:RnfH family protein [Mitsuaria sp. GD03876]MDH0866424.1 RnfH family protein [Mitsuaria sp. GD03876]
MVPAELSIELVWSPAPGELRERQLTLPAGATLRDALVASTWFEPDRLEALKAGIWGRMQPLDTPLRERDRVEVYRPLTVDPKEARRQRYQATGRRIVTRHRPLGRKA